MTDFENNPIPEQTEIPAAPEIPEVPAPEAPYTDPFQGQEAPQAPQPPQYAQQAPQYAQQPQYNQPYQQSPYQQPYQQPQQVRYDVAPEGYPQKSRLAAALLALIVGVFGVHNYYLGYKNKFIIQLVIALAGSLLCGIGPIVTAVWAFIEGVQLLMANNPDKNYDGNGVILKD